MVKNFMEAYIKEQLDITIAIDESYKDFAVDETLYKMAFAKALNLVKPSYFTTLTGEVYLTFDNIPVQARNDAIAAVVKALEYVKNERDKYNNK